MKQHVITKSKLYKKLEIAGVVTQTSDHPIKLTTHDLKIFGSDMTELDTSRGKSEFSQVTRCKIEC